MNGEAVQAQQPGAARPRSGAGWLRRLMQSVVRVGVVAYLGVTAVMYALQSSYVYFPDRTLYGTPRDVGLAYEDAWMTASDGVRIHGWFVPASGEARGVLLHCHGNAGNISGRLDQIRLLHGLGLSVLIFDYRGFGQSEGTPTEEGTYLDAEAAWTYLTTVKKVPVQPLIALW